MVCSPAGSSHCRTVALGTPPWFLQLLPAVSTEFSHGQPKENIFDECKGSKGRIVSLITASALSSKYTNELPSVCYDNVGQIQLVLIPPVVQLKPEMLHSSYHALLWDCYRPNFVAGKYVLSWEVEGLFSSVCAGSGSFLHVSVLICAKWITLITSISSQGQLYPNYLYLLGLFYDNNRATATLKQSGCCHN